MFCARCASRGAHGYSPAAMADDLRIIVLEGDQTGQELLDQAIRVLDPAVTRVDVKFEHYDLSLDNRRKTDNEVVVAAARAMAEAGYGLKAATVTPEGADDVGSPNRILREEIDGTVIAAMEERADELGLGPREEAPAGA